MKRSKYLIRPARAVDVGTLSHIHVATWRTDYRGFAPDDYLDALSVDDERNTYQTMIDDPVVSVFIAEDGDGRAVGLSTSGPYRDEGGEIFGTFSGELYNLYVLASARKSGVGRDLVRSAAQFLIDRGITSMILWTFEGYASSPFYRRLGGRVVGKREADIGGKTVHDLAYGWEDIGRIIDGP